MNYRVWFDIGSGNGNEINSEVQVNRVEVGFKMKIGKFNVPWNGNGGSESQGAFLDLPRALYASWC